MTKIRIQSHDKTDLLTIDVETGEVTHREGVDLNEMAIAFWGAVSVAAELFRSARVKRGRSAIDPGEVVFTGSEDGKPAPNMTLTPGGGGDGSETQPPGHGGDITITLPKGGIMYHGDLVAVIGEGDVTIDTV
jgi:hypothetical protein